MVRYFVTFCLWLGKLQKKVWVKIGLVGIMANALSSIILSLLLDKNFLASLPEAPFITWTRTVAFWIGFAIFLIIELCVFLVNTIYTYVSTSNTNVSPSTALSRSTHPFRNKKIWFVLLIAILIGAATEIIPIVYTTSYPTERGLGQFLWQNGQIIDCDASCSSDFNNLNEKFGVCEGSCAFDYASVDAVYKRQAVKYAAQSQFDNAIIYWEWATRADVTDAEAKIYLENLRIEKNNQHYSTAAVVISLPVNNSKRTIAPDEPAVSDGRDTLQGAYIMQHLYNQEHPAGPKLVLQIVNIGEPQSDWNAIQDAIARKIMIEAHRDVVYPGVIGLPYGSDELINTLNAASIPMISIAPGKTDDLISYLRRIAPSLQDEASDAANIINTYLQSQGGTRIHVMYEAGDDYSSALSDKFINTFTGLASSPKAVSASFRAGNIADITDIVHVIVSEGAKAVFFIGTPADALKLHAILPAQIAIIGSDALFKYVHLNAEDKQKLAGLTFLSFAFHDQWSIMKTDYATPAMKLYPEPAILNAYGMEFNPGNTRLGNYSYDRASSTTLLAYDALDLLVTAGQRKINQAGCSTCNLAKNECVPSTVPATTSPRETRWIYVQACTENSPFDGASGQISFSNTSSNPINKAVLVLKISLNDKGMAVTRFDQLYGQFFMGQSS